MKKENEEVRLPHVDLMRREVDRVWRMKDMDCTFDGMGKVDDKFK